MQPCSQARPSTLARDFIIRPIIARFCGDNHQCQNHWPPYSRAPRTRSFYEDHFFGYRMPGAWLQRRNARWESISIPVCAVFSPPWLASPRRAALDKMGLSNHRNPHFLGQNQPKCSVPKTLILRQDRDCPRWPMDVVKR